MDRDEASNSAKQCARETEPGLFYGREDGQLNGVGSLEIYIISAVQDGSFAGMGWLG